MIDVDELRGNKLYDAVWNNYAEFRESAVLDPGYVVCEKDNDTLIIASVRFQYFAGVISDTYSFSKG